MAKKFFTDTSLGEFVDVIKTYIQNQISNYASKSTKISAGTGLTGGGDISTNRTISLNDASIASLSRADSALQSITTASGSNINAVGTPSVTASTSNNQTTLTFNYLKGTKGDTGVEGTKTIRADSPTRTYSLSQWRTYGEPGFNDSWSNISNASSFRVGDIVVISGKISDQNNVGCLLYATVTGINDTSLSTTAMNLIVGDKGATGDDATVTVDSTVSTSSTNPVQNKVIASTYETKTDASAKLAEAKSYADTVSVAVKNDLLNGAGGAYDTLKELGDLIDDNVDAIEALETVAANKVDKVSGKGLSTNDYTTTEKNKLAGIATGANNYSLPTASSSTLGGVKIGSNITNSSGTISLTKSNVTSALGYTPPTSDTNTWRGIQDNLTSTSTEDSLSANQGKVLKDLVDTKANSLHTHNYAGSSSAGGSATSAVKLDTATAGSATQPVYFNGGKPVATTYTLGKSVPSDAKFTDTTYNVATQSTNGLLSAGNKTQLDFGGTPIVTTAGDGAAYTATVDGMTELKVGMELTIIPHANSSSTQPTLNVNSLGAKAIRMPISYNSSATSVGSIATWIVKNKPVTVQYDGSYWKTISMPRPSAQYLYGYVSVANGGTGATDAATARANLEVYSTTEIDTMIGNISTALTSIQSVATAILG